MSISSVLDWFDYLWDGFWNFLNGINMFGGLSGKDLFISFMIMGAILAFVFKRVAPSNE